jgi:hypothetical protein
VLQKVIISQRIDDNANRLYIVNEDGTGVATIAQQAGGRSSYKATLPDGRIIFETSFGTGEQRRTDLYLVNADGTGVVSLVDSADSESFQSITPSGRVVFTAGADLVSMMPDGGGRCVVGPAGEVLTVTASDQIILQPCFRGQCAIYVGTCSATTQLTPGSATFIGITSSGRIAYIASVIDPQTGNSSPKVHTNKLDGSDQKELGVAAGAVRIHEDSVIWQADGGMIRIASSDGTTMQVLGGAPSPDVTPLAVSPAGRLIYQVGGANRIEEVTDLYSVRLDGTDGRQIAGTTRAEVFRGMMPSGRVLYQQQPDPRINDPSIYAIRSVKDDGSDDLGLAVIPRTNGVDAITQTNRVVYANRTPETPISQYNVYAVNEDGTENYFLLSDVRYNASTLNDRIVLSQCVAWQRIDNPDVRDVCTITSGNVTSIKSDGTNAVSLGSGLAGEGFVGMYGPPEQRRVNTR